MAVMEYTTDQQEPRSIMKEQKLHIIPTNAAEKEDAFRTCIRFSLVVRK